MHRLFGIVPLFIASIVYFVECEEDVIHNGLAKVCHPLERTLDLLFILDGSGSVKGHTFDTQKAMVLTALDLVQIAPNKTRVAVLQYSGYTRVEFPFNEYTTKADVESALNSIRHISGTTKTGNALLKSRKMFKPEYGGRQGQEKVAQVVVVVSDGHSHDDPVPAAKLLRSDGVKLVAVGIGNHINMEELEMMTDDSHLAFTNETIHEFVHTFKTISTTHKCSFAKGPNGANVTCGSDHILVEVETSLPMEGQLHVNGYKNDAKCRERVLFESQTLLTLRIPLDECGLDHQIMLSPRGVLYSTAVVVQYHRNYHTYIDDYLHVHCFYMDTSGQPASLNQHVEDIPLHLNPQIHSHLYDERTVQMSDPNSHRYSVPEMNSPCTYTIKQRSVESCDLFEAQLGETVTHEWVCDNDVVGGENAMKIHTCFMEDVKDGGKIMVIDPYGCSLDPLLMTSPMYNIDFPMRVTASGSLVQVIGDEVSFSCQLTFCNKFDSSCDNILPLNCSESDGIVRKKRQTEGMPAHMIQRLFARRRFLQFQQEQQQKAAAGIPQPTQKPVPYPNGDAAPSGWVKPATQLPEPVETFTAPPQRLVELRAGQSWDVQPINYNEILLVDEDKAKEDFAVHVEQQQFIQHSVDDQTQPTIISGETTWLIHPNPVSYEQHTSTEENLNLGEAFIPTFQEEADYLSQEPQPIEYVNSDYSESQYAGNLLHSYQQKVVGQKSNSNGVDPADSKESPHKNDGFVAFVDSASGYSNPTPDYLNKDSSQLIIFDEPDSEIGETQNEQINYPNVSSDENTHSRSSSSESIPRLLTEEEYEAAINLIKANEQHVEGEDGANFEEVFPVKVTTGEYISSESSELENVRLLEAEPIMIHQPIDPPSESLTHYLPVENENAIVSHPKILIQSNKAPQSEMVELQVTNLHTSATIAHVTKLKDMKLHGLSDRILDKLSPDSFTIKSQTVTVYESWQVSQASCQRR